MQAYSPPPDPYLGQTIAERYYVQNKLGEGGMGAVYLATHVTLEKQVALKILHSALARRAELVQRFLQEAKAASRIRHENVIDITDFGSTQDGAVFFAMEVLQGHDLHDLITRSRAEQRPLPWERLKNIFIQVCAALSAAHECGVIHRDLKPENIYLVERRGTKDFVKLLDFGIAKLTEVSESERKLTRTGMLFGTPEYMSPEQARGDKVDHRVDVYAMGCILYQLLVGRVPFAADNFMGVLSRHLSDEPPVIPSSRLHEVGAPRRINEVIQRALAKKPGDRFQTIAALVSAVEVADRRTAPVLAIPDARSSRVPVARPPSAYDSTAPVTFDSESEPSNADAPDGESAAGKQRYGPMATAITEPGRTSTEEPEERGQRPGHQRPGHQRPDQTPGDQPEPIVAKRAPAPESGTGSFVWLVLLLFLLAGGGVGAFMVFGKKANDQANSPSPEAPSAAPDFPPPAAVTVTVSLESEPSGAQVFSVNGEKLGVTPLDLELEKSDQAREFRFVLADHEEKVISVVPDKARGQQVALVPREATEPAGDDPAAVDGDDPSATDPGTDTQGSANRDATRSADPKSADPKSADPKSADPKSSDPKSSDPKSSDPKSGDDKPPADDPTADPKIKNPFNTK